MKEICGKLQCTGCEACLAVCPHGAISMELGDDAFFYPCIDQEKCTDCGACKRICPANTADALPVHPLQLRKAFYGSHKDAETLLRSASGAVATALYEYIIDSGGWICGVEYADSFRSAVYSISRDKGSIEKYKTSKYTHAKKGSIYTDVKKALNTGAPVLFIGLPCEVAALLRVVGTNHENLLTCDLICHGVSSPLALDLFVRQLEKERLAKVAALNMRYKKNHIWSKHFDILVGFQNGKSEIIHFIESAFGKLFFQYKRSCCYQCQFKGDNHPADITIGDYWGIVREAKPYQKAGVSLLISHTDKGNEIIQRLSSIDIHEAQFHFDQPSNYSSSKTKPARPMSATGRALVAGNPGKAARVMETWKHRMLVRLPEPLRNLIWKVKKSAGH